MATFRVMQVTETGEEFFAFEGSEDRCDAWIDENLPQYEESSFYIERTDVPYSADWDDCDEADF